MNVTAPSGASPPDPVAFAERLLSLIDTGRKTATYKYAVLIGLVDLCLERPSGDNEVVEISARELGSRVFEFFWRHAVPYSTGDGGDRYLRHSVLSRHKQPDLVVKLERFRQQHHLPGGVTPQQARATVPVEFDALFEDVITTVIRMPIPKLQRFTAGGKTVEDRFLYDYNWPDEVPARLVRQPQFDDRLHLHPGVGALLARLGALLRPVIETRWAAFVAERSHDIVGQHDVTEFLFGADRITLAPIRAPLIELQHARCFYCGHVIGGAADVDHFIPWMRHPDNGIDNLVATHAVCNNRKRDSMAATAHLTRWIDRNHTHASELTEIASHKSWPRHPERTVAAARATYLWLPEATKQPREQQQSRP